MKLIINIMNVGKNIFSFREKLKYTIIVKAIYHIDIVQLRPDEGWTTDGDLSIVGTSLLSLVDISKPIESKYVTLAQPPTSSVF